MTADTDDIFTNITDPFDPEILDYELDFAGGVAISVILSIAMILIGVVLIIAGCRLFKWTLFTVAFVLGSFLGYYLFYNLIPDDSRSCLIAGAVVGLVLGVASTKLWKLSIFVLGAGVGLCLWLTFKALYPELFEDETVYYVSLIATVIVFGLISLKMEKTWLLFGTPVLGSFILIQGVDAFVPQNLNMLQILDFKNGGCALTECYVLYSAVLGLSLLGIFIQYRFTSEDARKRAHKREAKAEGKEMGKREAMKERRARRRSRIRNSYEYD